MALPKPFVNQTINALKGKGAAGSTEQLNYESHESITSYVNQLRNAMGPGTPISARDLVLAGMGTGAAVSSVSGTVKRGNFTFKVGTGPTPSPTIILAFASGIFGERPFATVVRNGGTGVLGFTFFESQQALTVTLSGTPTLGETYGFSFMVQE